MKENVGIGIAILAIIISVVAIASTFVVTPAMDIGASSVGENELKDESVTSSKILDGTIIDDDISDDGISKIADDAITSDQILRNSIMLQDLNSEVIAAMTGVVEIANNSITGEKIADGAINDAHIGDSAEIDPSKILGTAWTSTNDGTGSGLDADTLDGIDSGKFLRNDQSGVIEGDLTVEGSITHEAEIRYCSIPFCAFLPRYSADGYRIDTYTLYNADVGVTKSYYAPVNLPHGAHITSIAVSYDLDTDGSVSVRLERHYINTSSYLPIEFVSCISGSNRVDQSVDHTVDNSDAMYILWLSLKSGDSYSDAGLKGIILTYTVTNPLP